MEQSKSINFSIESDVLQDMIAMFGEEAAIQELLNSYKLVLQDVCNEIKKQTT